MVTFFARLLALLFHDGFFDYIGLLRVEECAVHFERGVFAHLRKYPDHYEVSLLPN